MPTANYDPDRIAALIGTLSSNPNEAEAGSAARLVRREADKAGIRLVDLFYRQDVMAALDAQLKPDHEMVHKSVVEAERQRADQAEANLAERERQAREIITELQSQLSAAQQQAQQQTQSHRGALEFLSFAWGFPQWRVIALLAFAFVCVVSGVDKPWAEFFLSLIGIWLFILWCAAEIDMSGWLLLVIKAGATVAAICAAAQAGPGIVSLFPVAVLVVGTRLLNNIGERLMRITLIANFVELFK